MALSTPGLELRITAVNSPEHEAAYQARKAAHERGLRIDALTPDRTHLISPMFWPSISPEMEKGEERVKRFREEGAPHDYVRER